MTHDDIQEYHLVVTKQPAVIIVILLVICLHAALLMLILNSSSVQKATIKMPVIAGVLIQMPSTKVVKAAKKIIRKKPTPVPAPKRLATPKKAITLPPVVKQKTQPPEIQETIDTAEESIEQKLAAIVSPRVDATRRSNPTPVYPRTSLRRKEQGKVILEVLVQVDGSVGEIRIKQSSGFKRLDKSAMKAVKRWRYIAAQQAGQAIEYWYQQPIVFSLRKKV